MPKLKVGTEFGGTEKVSALYKRMGVSADGFGRKSKRAFGKASTSATRFGNITKGILGAQLITGAVARLTQGAGIVAAGFLDLDDTITQAAVKFKDIGPRAANFKEKLEEIKKVARKAGEATIFTGTQAASALKTMAQGGFKSVTAIKALGGQIAFALATGEDFVTSTKTSTKILGGFGLAVNDPIKKVKNLAFVNDILAKTVNSSSINLENFFDAAKDIGPIARNLGSDLPEVASFVGVLGNSAIDASKAMTGLRSIFLRMAAPPTEAARVMKRLNLSLNDGSGNAKGMTKFLGELVEKTKGFGEIKKAGIFNELFGRVGIASAFILTDEINTGVVDFQKNLDGAKGEVAAMAKIMQNTLLSKIKKLKSASTELGFKFVEIFETKGSNLVDNLTDSIGKFDIAPVRELFEILEKAGKDTQLGGPIIDVLDSIARVLGVIGRISKATIPLIGQIIGDVVGGIKEVARARTPEEKEDARQRKIRLREFREQKFREKVDLFSPNQNQANNVNIRIGVESTVNTPPNSTSETKVKQLPSFNSGLGNNNVLATQ